MNKISKVKGYDKSSKISNADLIRTSALLNLYVADNSNSFNVPDYDRREGKRLVKLLREAYS